MSSEVSTPDNGQADLIAQMQKMQAMLEQKAQPNYKKDKAKVDAVNKAMNTPTQISVRDNIDPKGGFQSLNHFCHDVRNAGIPSGPGVSKSLMEWSTKAATGLNETAGAEGGFLVPPEFSNELMRRTYENDLLSRCKSYTCGGNSLVIPAVDETSRADGSRFGGVRGYWEAEANQFTSTKPRFSRLELVLKKLIALWYVTDELLQDSGTPMQQLLTDLFAQEIAFKMGDAIVNGTGSGMPQGLLNSPATVSVSKETGQAAATVVFENITKMWQRMWAPSRANAVWLIHQDIEHQLASLALNIGTAGTAAYLPAGGLSDTPYAKLMGRPVIPVEFCATLGTVGDIILVDFSQYLVLRKGESQSESSIHLRFDFAETAFRVIMRADGRCWWNSALVPKSGTNSLAPQVTLATRS